MSQALIDKIRAQRQTDIEAAGLVFIASRPTDLDVQEMRGKTLPALDLLKKYVKGWRGVKESDLINGGVPKLVEFTQELFAEWVGDRPDIFNPLVSGIIAAYEQHAQQQADTLKKPDVG
jgi:hypothetical protein